MLTVDFDRLQLRPGQRLLDLGCGAGRHSFTAFQLGAHTVALDYSADDLPQVREWFGAIAEAGDAPAGTGAGVMRGDALALAFPDNTFDRIIISEVLEHITNDAGALAEVYRVLKPGGIVAATVPAYFPEKICWWLSAEYHSPLAEGGHVRIYTERELRHRMTTAGFTPFDSHRAHALHAPYWWLKCVISPTNTTNPLVAAYHKLLVWDIEKAPALTRKTEAALNPVLGKSMVVYGRKELTS